MSLRTFESIATEHIICSDKGHFPLGGIFRTERHFLLFKDQLAESGRQKTKENIIPCGEFLLVENDPKLVLAPNFYSSLATVGYVLTKRFNF